jgi:hypothetical protein
VLKAPLRIPESEIRDRREQLTLISLCVALSAELN